MKVSIILAAGSFEDDFSLVADLVFGVAAPAPTGRSLTRGLTSIESFLGRQRSQRRSIFVFENDIVPPLFRSFFHYYCWWLAALVLPWAVRSG